MEISKYKLKVFFIRQKTELSILFALFNAMFETSRVSLG